MHHNLHKEVRFSTQELEKREVRLVPNRSSRVRSGR